ncbi:hypothetical protein DPMN_082231 [Dreissena polymorpha]|uniref:Uncharacterized protein n=1 Tax=Dreissena polymorpha TaxID=45954 RepID=A0A9D3Y789_DREPO|nr:hypothetical protein DPMN_082231 [Dreissena polymorpha]
MLAGKIMMIVCLVMKMFRMREKTTTRYLNAKVRDKDSIYTQLYPLNLAEDEYTDTTDRNVCKENNDDRMPGHGNVQDERPIIYTLPQRDGSGLGEHPYASLTGRESSILHGATIVTKIQNYDPPNLEEDMYTHMTGRMCVTTRIN